MKVFYLYHYVRNGGDSAVVIAESPQEACDIINQGKFDEKFYPEDVEEIGIANPGKEKGVVIHETWHA